MCRKIRSDGEANDGRMQQSVEVKCASGMWNRVMRSQESRSRSAVGLGESDAVTDDDSTKTFRNDV
jgi:hypothetical protein